MQHLNDIDILNVFDNRWTWEVEEWSVFDNRSIVQLAGPGPGDRQDVCWIQGEVCILELQTKVIQRYTKIFTILEKATTRAFSLLKAKALSHLRHYAKQAINPR